MTRCPHCDRIANPLRLFNYSGRRPYICPHCRQRSKFNRLAVALIAGIVGGASASMVHGLGLHGFSYIAGLFLFVVLFVTILAPANARPARSDAM